MKILLAPDKFKGSLSANDFINIVQKAFLTKCQGIILDKQVMADGGEGSLDLLESNPNLIRVRHQVSDPLFRKIEASFLIDRSGSTAYIEMSRASGLELLGQDERNCMNTTSVGTGELIAHAIEMGARSIFLFVGGSATNDAGIGMASALGYGFTDKFGNRLKPVGANLIHIAGIEKPRVKAWEGVKFNLISDVDNPMHGPNGAARVYAAQKGADRDEIEILNTGLNNIDRLFQQQLGRDVSQIPGSGAAGAIAAGAMTFLDAGILRGIDFIITLTGLEKRVQEADLIISGEGSLDSQSLQGKVISGIGSLCRKYNKPCWIICGVCQLSSEELRDSGIRGVLSLSDIAGDKQKAKSQAKYWLKIASEILVRKIDSDIFLK